MRGLSGFDRSALLLTLLLGITGLAYLWTPTDNDLWWHLRNGQVVLQAGVPQTDIYSFTAPGVRWIMQAWLADAAMYLVQTAAGYGLLLALFALASVATYAVFYGVLRGAGAGPTLAVGLLVVRIIMDAPAWGARPQILSGLFFTFFLAILLAYRVRASAPPSAAPPTGLAAWIGPDRRLWLLPPLMLLWANIHAGFTVGVEVLAVWIVGESLNRALGWRPTPPLRPLLAVAGACLLVSLLNPNGSDLWLYAAGYIGGPQRNNLLLYTQEWQPPDPRTLQGLPFVLTLLALAAVAILRPREPVNDEATPQSAIRNPQSRLPFTGDATLLLGLGGFLLMALQAQRLLPQWGAFWAVAMAGALPRLWPALGRDRDAPTPRWRAGLNLGLTAGTLVVLAAILLVAPRAQIGPQPHETGFPAEAVAYLAAHPDAGADPLYNEYAWGGYLIARRWPTHPVFIDGRADMYEGVVLANYVATLSGGPDWPTVFTKYGVRGALVPTGAPLARALAATPGWQQVCCAGGPAALFVRR